MDWSELAELALIAGGILTLSGAGALLAQLLLGRKTRT